VDWNANVLAGSVHFKSIYTNALIQQGIYVSLMMAQKSPPSGKWRANKFTRRQTPNLLLPRALFMAIGLQALFALVLVHLETAFLFEVTHVVSGLD
jgi:hypothetical protein